MNRFENTARRPDGSGTYTDCKNRSHHVMHSVLLTEEDTQAVRQRVVNELCRIFEQRK